MAEPQLVPYPDHPQRCQGRSSARGMDTEQCSFIREPNSEYCFIHGGNKGNAAAENKSLGMYRLGKFEKRLRELQVANGARTIDEELSILRMILEETLNKCGDNMELLLYSTKISEIIINIKGLVVVADKLATKSGMLIGRSEAIVIAGKVVDCISRHITDESLLGAIAEDLVGIFITPTTDSEV
jgi:hypothetical protein